MNDHVHPIFRQTLNSILEDITRAGAPRPRKFVESRVVAEELAIRAADVSGVEDAAIEELRRAEFDQKNEGDRFE